MLSAEGATTVVAPTPVVEGPVPASCGVRSGIAADESAVVVPDGVNAAGVSVALAASAKQIAQPSAEWGSVNNFPKFTSI